MAATYRISHPFLAVIPAEAGIHVAFAQVLEMDSRFLGNDGNKSYNPCGKINIASP
ncbi:hypothetical protein GCM10011408_14110 [Dyella caseinilytica]|nr:hypothetical protein GCM10011408_14110 [Dyella caseinilytica]